MERVCEVVSKYWWDKVKRLIKDLVDMEDKEEGGFDRSKMELIKGFMLYVARTYQDMNPYLKGFHLNLDSWRPFGDNKGWRMQGEK